MFHNNKFRDFVKNVAVFIDGIWRKIKATEKMLPLIGKEFLLLSGMDPILLLMSEKHFINYEIATNHAFQKCSAKILWFSSFLSIDNTRRPKIRLEEPNK